MNTMVSRVVEVLNEENPYMDHNRVLRSSTSLVIRLATVVSSSAGRRFQSAVMKSTVSTALKSGKIFQGKAINYKKDGTPFIMYWRVLPIKVGKVIQAWVAIQREGSVI